MIRLRDIFICLILLTACEKPEEFIPPPPAGGGDGQAEIDKLPMKLVWRNKLNIDSSHSMPTMQPVVFEDRVLFSSYNPGPYLRCYSARYGAELWRWKEYLHHSNPNDLMNQSIHNNYWLYDAQSEMGMINMYTGETLWQKENINKRHYSKINGDYIYYSIEKHWASSHNIAGLRRTPVSHFAAEHIIDFRADTMEGKNHVVDPPSIWQAPWGDEIAVFKLSGIDWRTNREFWHLYAYNLDGDSIYYKALDIAPARRGNSQYPVIDGHYAYLQTHRTLQCYDLLKREQVWQHTFDHENAAFHFTFPNIIVDQSKVYILGDAGDLFAFDKLDGTQLWRLKDDPGGGLEEYMVLYKGVLYYTGEKGAVYGVRAADGEVLLKMKSYNNEGYYRGGLGISEQYNQLYVSDGYDVMAFEIPEKWHYD